MENHPSFSYPDSGDSSPGSRETDFENPTPSWEEQPHSAATIPPNHKVKFMVSYNGEIQPRSHDNILSYVGGDTKILSIERSVTFPAFRAKINALLSRPDSTDSSLGLKYQLPGEDLDNLISVTNDDDLEYLMQEYDRVFKASQPTPLRLRLFLFPDHHRSKCGSRSVQSDPEKVVAGAQPDTEHDRQYQQLGFQSQESVPVHNNVDFLFGLDNSPVRVREPELVHEVNRMTISGQECQQQQSAFYPPEKYENFGDPYRKTPSPTSMQLPHYWQPVEQPPPQIQQQQPVYMMHAPPQVNLYHEPAMSPANQSYYPVKQMPPDQLYGIRPVYSIPATFPKDSSEAGESAVYIATGRPVYYAAAAQQGNGAVAGPQVGVAAVASNGEGKVVQINVAPASGGV